MARFFFLFAALFLIACGQASQPQAPQAASSGAIISGSGPRLALVMGNQLYMSRGWELTNPKRDAELVASRLRTLNFDVTLVLNASKQQMEEAMARFGEKVRQNGKDAVAVFYYAGHGVEQDGANYLIPVDVTASTMDRLKYQSPPMQLLLEEMAKAGNAVNIVILDACRNLPLPVGVRGAPAGGLAELNMTANVLVAYATRPGRTAADDPGSLNSTYTRILADALVRHADKPVELLFSHIQSDVVRATKGAQEPEYKNGLRIPGWRFSDKKPIEVTAEPAVGPTPLEIEFAYWSSCCVTVSPTSADLTAYLERVYAGSFPGTYADIAHRRLEEMSRPPPSPPQTPSEQVQVPTVSYPRPSPPLDLLGGGYFVRSPTREVMQRAYPRRAASRGISGRVDLRCRVSSDGGLEACSVLSERPRNRDFGDAALDLTSEFRVTPKTDEGRSTADATLTFVICFGDPRECR